MKKKYYHLVLLILLVISSFPIYWMLRVSFASNSELFAGLQLVPKSVEWLHFFNLFQHSHFLQPIGNSFLITLVSLLLVLAFGIPSAYILSNQRFFFPLDKFFLAWTFLVRILPPITFALPLFILMNKLNLLHTFIPIVSAHVLVNLPFVIWFMILFFNKIPVELEESARVDGASDWSIFIKIVFPLVLPAVATASIFSFMASWNEYIYGVIFIQSPAQFTLPLKLATMNSEQELLQWGEVAAGGVLSLLPVVIITIFLQKYLVSGLTAGAVKE